MAIYAIGDIQGCMTSLEALLAKCSKAGFSLGRDTLWLAGDLVNRGPRSLDVLRWAYEHRDHITTVLGNHDLHALLRFAGHAKEKKRDTLDALLAAHDAPVLFNWLRSRPFLAQQRVGDIQYVMVHAGLAPTWTVSAAARYAHELEQVLRAPTWMTDLERLVGKGVAWRDDLAGDKRLHSLLLYFTRVRTLDANGEPDPDFDGELAEMPAANTPWFAVKGAAWQTPTSPATTVRAIFGHWAALGVTTSAHHLSLDSGCVWGRALSARRLDDDTPFSVSAVD